MIFSTQHVHAGESIVERYLELLMDPAHLMLELTFIIIVDFVVLTVLWPLVGRKIANRWLQVRLKERDRDHGHNNTKEL